MGHKKKVVFFLVFFTMAFFLLATSSLFAQDDGKNPRNIEIVYDFDSNDLSIIIDNTTLKNFPLLLKTDNISLTAKIPNNPATIESLNIKYKILDSKQNTISEDSTNISKETKVSLLLAVNHDLMPGGKLFVSYNLKTNGSQAAKSREITFPIKKDPPNGPRKIDVIYDFDDTTKQPQIKINGEVNKGAKPILLKDDEVVLYAYIVAEDDIKLAIDYEIKGDDPNANLKKYFESFFPMLTGKASGIPQSISIKRYVEDDLIPGGKITISFSVKNKNDEIQKTQKEIFKIEDEEPFIITSTGIAASTENARVLAFKEEIGTDTKSANVEDTDKENKFLTYENDQQDLKIKQSLIQFLHVHIVWKIYGTIGVPINEKIFSEPYFGVSYFLRKGLVGALLNVGVRLYKEISVDPASGYVDDEGSFKPVPKDLTLDKITTISKSKYAFFIGISFKF